MKQFFNIVASACELIVLSLLFFIMAVWIKVDATGPVFYRQVRVGRYNKDFKIFKFRSMRVGANKGSLVTIGSRDPRDTCIGDYYCKRIMISRLSVSCVAICSPFSEMVAPPPATPSRNPNIQGGGGDPRSAAGLYAVDGEVAVRQVCNLVEGLAAAADFEEIFPVCREVSLPRHGDRQDGSDLVCKECLAWIRAARRVC